MAGLPMLLLASFVSGVESLAISIGAGAVPIGAEPVEFIPRTNVPLPANYEDYARGRTPIALFPKGQVPGKRTIGGCSVPEDPTVPCFWPENRSASPESFMTASPLDPVGVKCAPCGHGANGHYFYNVWEPEVVPFIVPEGTPGRKDTAVIIAPGGGGIHLAWDGEGISPAERWNAVGVSAFVLKYRVPSEDVQILDAQRAVSLVRSKAASYGLNASRIGFMGSSAGGQLCFLVGTQTKRTYDRIDDIDDLKHIPDFLVALYPGIPDPRNVGNLAVLPPTFTAYSTTDPCCPAFKTTGFLAMAKLFSKAPITSEVFHSGGHGWGDIRFYKCLEGSETTVWFESAANFLKGIGMISP